MVDKEKWLNLVDEYIMAHVFEVGTETTLKWIQMLFEKRYVNFLDYYEGQIEFKTKKGETEFKKYFKDNWIKGLQKYQEALRKAKTEEAKDEIRKNGVKRKTQGETTKKKSKKK